VISGVKAYSLATLFSIKRKSKSTGGVGDEEVTALIVHVQLLSWQLLA